MRIPNITKTVKLILCVSEHELFTTVLVTLYTAEVSRKNANQRRKDFMFLRHLFLLQVEESQLRLFLHRDRERLTAQLILDVVELHSGSLGRLELTCLSTIPGFLGPEQSEYADRKTSSVTGMMQDLVCSTY
jgi:hypothetical protein